jgi:glyceraldehyde 3-phosphate dehydrogenase
MANFGINGFGRIGRNVLRAMSQQQVAQVKAINDLTDTHTLAHLLKWDSVHGKFDGEIGYDDENIIVRGQKIKVLKERDPGKLPWKDLAVDVVLESTGLFTTREKAELHFAGGAKKVLISAPATNPDATICLGINDEIYDGAKMNVISNASCTTNCLAPLAKVLHDNFTIVNGFMTTIHSYTNDQAILDLPHKDLRRARAAALSMIPTTTGAASAVGEVLPELKGKLDGFAMRVPTPNVSVVDLAAIVDKKISADELNAALKEAAEGSMKGILAYSTEELVSIDFKGNPNSSIVDMPYTKVMEGDFLKILSWYDNEWGYSNRCVDLLRKLVAKGL